MHPESWKQLLRCIFYEKNKKFMVLYQTQTDIKLKLMILQKIESQTPSAATNYAFLIFNSSFPDSVSK